MRLGIITKDSKDIINRYYDLYECILIKPESYTLEDLINKVIESRVQACICDNRLGRPFSGAKLVETLFNRGIPCILISKYPTDFNLDIRIHRKNIPIAFHWDEFRAITSKELNNLFNICLQEITGVIMPSRLLNYTNIEVIGIQNRPEMLEVVLTSWKPYTVFLLPILGLPLELVTIIKNTIKQRRHCYIKAYVNTEAVRLEDIYFDFSNKWEII